MSKSGIGNTVEYAFLEHVANCFIGDNRIYEISSKMLSIIEKDPGEVWPQIFDRPYNINPSWEIESIEKGNDNNNI